MTDAKQRSGPSIHSKRLLPYCLIAGFILFFLFGGHEFLSLSQLAKNYKSLKDFGNGQLTTALLVFGVVYTLTVALSLPVASLLTLAGGALFGWTAAAASSSSGATPQCFF